MEISIKIQRLLIRLLVGLLALSCLMIAQADAVELQPNQGIANLGPHLKYHSDPDAKLATILKRFRDGKFSDTLKVSSLASNYAPEAWGAVELTNASSDDGRGSDPFVVTMSLALASEVDIYLVRQNGFTESVLNYSAFDPFDPTNHSVTRLRTQVFNIAPQEVVTLLVNFKFGPIQSFLLSLETPTQLEASAFSAGVIYTAFYAFCIACLVFFFGFNMAMKNWIGGLYILLFSIGLAIIAYIDGILFRFLYPDHPQWHSIVGFSLLFSISAIGFLLAGRSVVKKSETGLSETGLSVSLTSMAVLPVIGFVVSLYWPGTYVALSAYVLLILMLMANFVAGFEWKKRGGDIEIGALLIAGFSVVAVFALFAFMIIGWANEIVLIPDVAKAVFAVLLLATMIGLTAHIINLRVLHAKAVRAEIAALKEETQRSQELLAAEKNYSRARDLATLRQRQLATASHDLKQPIASLRMTFDTIADGTDPTIRERLREAFDYMEALSDGYLKETAPDSPGTTGASRKEGHQRDEQGEVYPLSIVLGTVHQMFHEEAISKGLQLRLVRTSLEVQVPPIILMRIVSNLVSNAIKYTVEGAVLIGVRRAGHNVILQIVDSGPGMDVDEIAQFKLAYKKGSRSKGDGLGLAVCFDLAAANNLDLQVKSVLQKGTIFSLKIPRV